MESKLVVKLDGSQAKREAAAVDNSLGKMEKAGTDADKSVKKLSGSTKSLASQMTSLKGGLIGVAAVMGVRKVVQYADAYTNLRNRLRNVVASENELIGVEKKLFALAQATRGAYEATVITYSRLAMATQELGLGQASTLRITETLNKAVALGGATSQEAAAGLIQFSQGLASGRLQGDELRSVMENLIGVSNALIDGFSKMRTSGEIDFEVTRGNIRQLAADGVLSADMLTKALLKAGDEVDKKFAAMSITFGQAMTQADNMIGRVIARLNSSTGLTGALTTMTKWIATLFSTLTLEIIDLGDLFGALAAQIVAYVKLDFEGAKKIGAARKERRGEMEKELALLKGEVEGVGELNEAEKIAIANKNKLTAAQTALNATTSDYINDLYFEIAMYKLSERDRTIAIAQKRLDAKVTQEQRIQIAALTGTLYDLKNAEKEAADQTSELTDQTEELSTVLDTQLSREIERLDDAFVDLWKSGLDSFEDFKTSLINSFKQMMATLIHEATTKKLVSFVGGMLGAGTATAGSGAASVVSGGASSVSMLQGLSSFASDPGSTLSGFAGSAIDQVGNALHQMGFESAAESFVSAGFENIVNATAMQMGATFLAGVAGSFAGNAAGEALFGKQAESNIGATIGGTVGAIWGAPGAFVGSTLGGIADVAFGGDGKKRAKLGVGTGSDIFSGGSVQDTLTAASGLELTALAKRVGDDTGGQSAIDMMNNLAAIDEVLTTATRLAGETVDLAGVSLAGRGTQGGGKGPATGFGSFGFNGLDTQALIDAPKEFIISWIDAVSATFDSGLRESVTNLTGTAEEILSQYAEVLTLKGLIDSFDETFTMVIGLEEAFNGLGEAGLSSYNQMLDYADALTTLADNAGPEHVELLSGAVQGLGEISRQVADQIMAAKAQIEGDFDSLINKIQFDLLETERDRYDFLKSQADALSETLGTLTDPEQIRDTASQIQQLTGQAFGVLGDTSQSAMSGEIIGFLEGVESQAQAQLDAAMQIVETIADPTAAGSPANAIEAALSRWEAGFMERYQAFLDAGEAAQAENTQQFGLEIDILGNAIANFPDSINVNVDVGELTP